MNHNEFIEKIKYILNFDENKLFNTELDDRYTNKEAYKEDIKKAKEKLKKYLSNTSPMNTARAFALNELRIN